MKLVHGPVTRRTAVRPFPPHRRSQQLYFAAAQPQPPAQRHAFSQLQLAPHVQRAAFEQPHTALSHWHLAWSGLFIAISWVMSALLRFTKADETALATLQLTQRKFRRLPKAPARASMLAPERAAMPHTPSPEATEALAPNPEVLARLLASHRDFLAFLQARVGNRAIAEELLQNAFVRAIEKSGALRETESAVAWFYRLLRNALVDHYRRSASEARKLDHEASDADAPADAELEAIVCACMHTLLPTLKPEYAQLIQRSDLEGLPITTLASELGITVNNATVRLHRARQALKRQLEHSCGTCATHGCLDCSCGEGAHA